MTIFLQILLSGLITGSVYGLVALGFTMVFNVSRVLNLAQGVFLTYGALVTYSAFAGGLPFWTATVLGLAAVAVMGVLIDRIGLGRAYQQEALAPLLVITIGLSLFFEGVAQLLWGTTPVRLPPLWGEGPVTVRGVSVAPQALVIIVVAALAAGAAALFFSRTALGRTMRAVADNRIGAALIGIDVRRVGGAAFALAGVLGGLVGILLPPLAFASYDSGTLVGLKGAVGAILGGLHSPLGALAGGLVLGVVEALGIGYVSSLFNNTTTFLALVLVLVVRSYARRPHLEMAPRQRARYQPQARARWWQGLIAAGIVLAALPFALPNAYLLALATLIGVLGIAVIGLDLLKGFAGVLSLGQAAFMGLAAYASAILTLRLGWDPLAALLVAAAAAAGVALFLALSSVRLEGYNMALATLGFSVVLQDLLTGARDVTGGASGITGVGEFSVAGIPVRAGAPMFYLVWALALAGAVLIRTLRHSQPGRAIDAVGQQEVAAAAMGIPVKRYKVAAFVIAAVFASVAGSLYAHLNSFVSPSLAGMGTSISLLTMLTVGGEGYVWGALAGTALIKLIPQVFSFLAGRELLVEGLILVLAMKFLPDGLWGTAARLFDRAASSAAARRALRLGGEVGEASTAG